MALRGGGDTTEPPRQCFIASVTLEVDGGPYI